jgi:TM2 domain-containing membrane protein YozV
MPTDKQQEESFSFNLFGLIKFACSKPGKNTVRMLIAVLVFVLLLLLITALFLKPQILATVAALRVSSISGQWGNRLVHQLKR